MTRRRARNVLIAGLGVLALIAIGFARDGMGGRDEMTVFSGGDDFDGGSGEFVDGSGPVEEEAYAEDHAFSDADSAGRAALQAGSGVSMGGGGATAGRGAAYAASDDSTGGTGGSGDAASSVPLPPIPDSERIVKDGRIEIEVPKGGFDRAFAAVLSLANKVNGQVVNSQSTRDEERASGEVTIRVPAQRFEELLASSNGIGTIQHRSVTSQDVSGEFVDLQARLRHLQAQEQFYLGLLGKARVVGDAIAINQHLSTVQAEMEQIQGRVRLLDERSTYSRLTLSLYEPGVSPLLSERLPERQGVLGQAWRDAVLALQETVGALLVGAFTMAPLLALGLVAWGLWRRLRPRPADEDPRPAVEEKQGPLPVG